ncbi:hypothetical protein [Sanyastnella coralliicola]|uniref:hypothetical protein n=1 Tax=Sanyastnella coralliicola TaxID=3069118 RepID=UPI0027BA1E5B|nr:hypothetical protein [Longitalea sp. SCSIO 12813]
MKSWRQYGLVLLSFFFFAGACQDEEGLLQFKQLLDEQNTQLINGEHFAIENYFDRQEFHKGMIMECTAKDSAPYPQLSAHVESMRVTLNEMQEARAAYYNWGNDELTALSSERKIEQSAFESMETKFTESQKQALEIESRFKAELHSYDSIIAVHEITFVSHELYADSLLVRIMQWEDSLEAQGSAIASSKQTLNQLGWDKRSEEYRNAYQPVSEMQANHKVLESTITGSQNAQDRYVTARPTDGFYYGPYMNERPDVDATERIFLKLDSIMSAFRSFEEQFQAQF